MWRAICRWTSAGALNGLLRSGLFVSTTATTFLGSIVTYGEPHESAA